MLARITLIVLSILALIFVIKFLMFTSEPYEFDYPTETRVVDRAPFYPCDDGKCA